MKKQTRKKQMTVPLNSGIFIKKVYKIGDYFFEKKCTHPKIIYRNVEINGATLQ